MIHASYCIKSDIGILRVSKKEFHEGMEKVFQDSGRKSKDNFFTICEHKLGNGGMLREFFYPNEYSEFIKFGYIIFIKRGKNK